jgi:hypothetical protein
MFQHMEAIEDVKGEIPEDVMKAAVAIRALPNFPTSSIVYDIARAILAERERCAKIADGLTAVSHPAGPLYSGGMIDAAKRIASSIRSGART